ncbi:MAG TPA: glycerol-3-phosphate acyltransferase [Acidimicrobiia bacterium]|nr:glycerol-3-phosphate acyltransferase [Acidimicrobiia bacterium]
MSVLVAALAGYVLGSIPTANVIAELFGLDLRARGSKNPGANNALRLGGFGLAASVLSVEAAKGASSVALGGLIGGHEGMVAAGIGAAAGNVFNVWYRFRGGKGLGIVLGVLLIAWPVAIIPTIVAIAALIVITRSSGTAALGALIMLLALGFLWEPLGWPVAWGVSTASLLPWLAAGVVVILAPKHFKDALNQPVPHP